MRLAVDRLEVVHDKSSVPIVDDVSFSIEAGDVLGLVGESGSGKTTLGLALLGWARPGARISSGRVCVDGDDMLAAPESERRRRRGAQVAYVPQDPGSALNPALRLGRQLTEVLEVHQPDVSSSQRRGRIDELMDAVQLERTITRRFPHQLSGGQQQRIALAMAFAPRPAVLVLDEPTTGLDVTTQRRILDLVRELSAAEHVATIYVSHDLAAVAALADRVAVLYAGRLAELGPAEAVLAAGRHPYARRLAAATPAVTTARALLGIPGRAPSPSERPPGCAFAPRCDRATDACERGPLLVAVAPGHDVACWHPHSAGAPADCHAGAPAEDASSALTSAPLARRDPRMAVSKAALEVRDLSASYGRHEVVHALSISVPAGGCVAVVGESGSGKTTLARSIAGLHDDHDGQVELHSELLAASVSGRTPTQRRALAYVFQNPYASLNPRRTIGEIVEQPVVVFHGRRAPDRRARVVDALERVSLHAGYMNRLPGQLSGGERQRVAIARALVAEPSVLICDEITSALDVSVQASIVALLDRLRSESDLSILFITHNLPLVRSIASDVVVMHRGAVVEAGTVESVLDRPAAAYTRRLIENTPSLDHLASPGPVQP